MKANPLQGKCIVLTRPEGQNDFLKKQIAVLGGMVYEFPAIHIVERQLDKEEEKYLSNITSFDWIIFTSANGVHACMKKLAVLGISPRSLSYISIGVIGPATRHVAEGYGLSVAFEPSSYISSKIPEEIGNVQGKKILLPRADIASKELLVALQKKGAEVINIPIYTTEYITKADPVFETRLHEGSVDYITFTSSSTVQGFMKKVEHANRGDVLGIDVVCIGPVTGKTAEEAGFRKIHVADTFTLKGVLHTLVQLGNE